MNMFVKLVLYPCLGFQRGHVILLVMAIFCIPYRYSALQGCEIVHHQLRWFGFLQMQWQAIQHICFLMIARIVSTLVIEEGTRRFHHNRSWIFILNNIIWGMRKTDTHTEIVTVSLQQQQYMTNYVAEQIWVCTSMDILIPNSLQAHMFKQETS